MIKNIVYNILWLVAFVGFAVVFYDWNYHGHDFSYCHTGYLGAAVSMTALHCIWFIPVLQKHYGAEDSVGIRVVVYHTSAIVFALTYLLSYWFL